MHQRFDGEGKPLSRFSGRLLVGRLPPRPDSWGITLPRWNEDKFAPRFARVNAAAGGATSPREMYA